MHLTESLIDGISDIRSHLGRTLLQVIGIVLGVASVVATNSMISGGREQSLSFYEEMGGLRRIVVSNDYRRNVRKTAREKASQGLEFEDLDSLLASEYVERIEPTVGRSMELSLRRFRKKWYIEGVTHNYEEVFNFHIARGRFINQQDLNLRNRVVVLGTRVAQRLFGTGDPLGKIVYIDGHGCEVIGILEEKNFEFNQWSGNALDWMNEMVFLPVTTMAFSFLGTRNVDRFNLQIRDVNQNIVATEDIRRRLKQRHRNIEDFRIWDRKARMESHQQQSAAFNVLFTATGAISLLVGGIVIMNILLASFYERVREVGIRKALGATGYDIVAQFLVESVVITILGGILGLFLGMALVKVIHRVTGQYYPVPASSLILAFGFSVCVGIVAGFYPALKAARLNPVEALRYE